MIHLAFDAVIFFRESQFLTVSSDGTWSLFVGAGGAVVTQWAFVAVVTILTRSGRVRSAETDVSLQAVRALVGLLLDGVKTTSA